LSNQQTHMTAYKYGQTQGDI